MDYYIDKKLAFFHIPKTGGTTVKEFLIDCYRDGKLGVERTRISSKSQQDMLENMVIPIPDFKYITVLATIRNPYASAVSLYFFARKLHRKMGKPPPKYPQLQIAMEADFHDFVRWYCDNWPSFFDYLKVGKSIPRNVRYLRLENLEEDLGTVLNSELGLGVDISIKRKWHVTGEGAKYHNYFDRELYNLINEKQEHWFKEGYYNVE